VTDVDCPVCDWKPDDDADNPRNSVVAHMSSSKGEHEGIGYQKAEQMLDVDATMSGDNSDTMDNTASIDADADSDDLDDAAADADDASDTGLGLSGPPDTTSATDPSDAADAHQDNTDSDNTDTATMDNTDPDAAGDADDGASSPLAWGLLVAGLVAALAYATPGREQHTTDQQPEPDLV